MTAITHLKTHQANCLKKIGFESLLGMKIDSIPSKLAFYVVDNFDTEKMVIRVPAGEIPVNEDSVSQILGLKNEGLDITNDIQTPEKWDQVLLNWKSQFQNPSRIRPSDVLDKLIKCNNTKWIFKTNFIVLFVNAIATSMKMGLCNIAILSKLEEKLDFGKINWCKYIIKCAKESKQAWKKESDEGVYTGPVTFLTVYISFSSLFYSIFMIF